MEPLLSSAIMTYTDTDVEIVRSEHCGLPIAASDGHQIQSYIELLCKVAALNYHNSRFRLLFRGQTKDYKPDRTGQMGVHSCLFPSILRPSSETPKTEKTLDGKFERLALAEQLLKEKLAVRDVYQNQLVRWAILQHYEICDTPLLDVSESLQIALSFAVGKSSSTGFLYVFAFPQLTGPISVSIESMTQVVDLCQLCPPKARRPHFQVAMLAGDYPPFTNREETHGKMGMIGNNFACRLIAKFALQNCDNWRTEGFTPTPEMVLFPNSKDEWYSATQEIKATLDAS